MAKIQALSKDEQEIVSRLIYRYADNDPNPFHQVTSVLEQSQSGDSDDYKRFVDIMEKKPNDLFGYLISRHQLQDSIELIQPLSGTTSHLVIETDLYNTYPNQSTTTMVGYQTENMDYVELLAIDQFSSENEDGNFGAYFYGNMESEEYSHRFTAKAVKDIDDYLNAQEGE